MLKLARNLEAEIRSAGESAYPNECCGILLGTVDGQGGKTVRALRPIVNSREQEEQHHRFLITEDEMVLAEMEAGKRHLDIVGFYHSHPDHPAEPSGYDRDHALPFYSYVILSVKNRKAELLASWLLENSRAKFNREPVEII
ncbi:MAG: Mov34/MPN/PAD-1 family protein [Lentisphaerae bacterium ADurb.Bin242]|nr:MAG: Mov34/MPN/PAD-1 family protein [Lentisphaerae bacterium ADurb.Bin242]